MCAKHYENLTMLSRVTAKNVGDVFFETHCRRLSRKRCKIGGKLVLEVANLVTLNGIIVASLRDFTDVGSFRGALRKGD